MEEIPSETSIPILSPTPLKRNQCQSLVFRYRTLQVRLVSRQMVNKYGGSVLFAVGTLMGWRQGRKRGIRRYEEPSISDLWSMVRNHLDDFLRGRIIGRLEYVRTQLDVSEELGISQCAISRLWKRFQDDGNVSRRYSTGRHSFQHFIWQLLPKETDGAQHQTCLVSSLQLPARQF
ncbi:uncharacterized protein TNCV_2237521 [Trichonephila clavipes]|nr:uncharacterized protein TNCV_2237521 [Trichonephila clavipes]